MLVKLNITILVALLIANPGIAAADNKKVLEVHYRGEISGENNRKFFSSIKGQQAKRLLISSTGGEVEAGIELGRWVFLHDLDVVVEDVCLSSCANYVFTAGVKKLILPGAIVAWHGNYHHLQLTGGWKDDIESRMSRYDESRQQAQEFVMHQLDKLVQLEKDFFSMIAVDEAICWIAKLPPYSVSDYYFLSIEDMASFGVVDVESPIDYRTTDVSHLPVSVIYVNLKAK